MTVDPVYAMIEQHKALSAAYDACNDPAYLKVAVSQPEAEDVVERTLDALIDGTEELLAFQPLTLRGVVAQLRYLSGVQDWQVNGRLTDEDNDVQELCATMAAAIEAIIERGIEAPAADLTGGVAGSGWRPTAVGCGDNNWRGLFGPASLLATVRATPLNRVTVP